MDCRIAFGQSFNAGYALGKGHFLEIIQSLLAKETNLQRRAVYLKSAIINPRITEVKTFRNSVTWNFTICIACKLTFRPAFKFFIANIVSKNL